MNGYNPTGQKFDYYPENEPLSDGGITIVKMRYSARLMGDTKYLVQYHCCGKEAVMTHKQVNERVRHVHTLCLKCARARVKFTGKRNRKQPTKEELLADYDVLSPNWPVPQSVLSWISAKGWYEVDF